MTTIKKGVRKSVKKKGHPRFKRPNVGRTKRSRLKDKWRKPRGVGNKQRQKLKQAGKRPSIGYGNKNKHIHPRGKKEIVVHNLNQLNEYKNRGDEFFIRIGSSVGVNKRIKMLKLANEFGLYVLNRNIKIKIKPKRIKLKDNQPKKTKIKLNA